LKDYLLHTLAPEDFEDLVVQICLRVLGTGTISFAKGVDGGRDAKFVGKANRFPSEESPWSGRFVVQAKSTSNPIASCSDASFARVLRNEISRMRALRSAGECDNYVLFTNRKLTAGKERELTAYLREETGVPNVAIVGREVIASYISNDPALRETRYNDSSRSLSSLCQVPPPPRDFTGRSDLLNTLRTAIDRDGTRIIGLSGMGGAGKTALALKLANSCTQMYSDAQLYLDMNGLRSVPLSPLDAMAKIIRSFHPNEYIPSNEDEVRGLYYSVLNKKRALLILDNAANANQLLPLIPPADCMLIVTSRQRLHLPGMLGRSVEELPQSDARSLLLAIAPRIAEEADDIARICGCLPMALRLAGSALVERPNLNPRRYAEGLRDKQQRLDLVSASIDMSYNLLDDEDRRKWNALSIFFGDFDAKDAAAIWECGADESEAILGELVRSSMVVWREESRRYHLHDLLRLFADDHLIGFDRSQAVKAHSKHYSVILARAALFDRDESVEAWALGLATRVYAQIIYNSEWDDIRVGYEWAHSRILADKDAAIICSDYAIAGVSLHRRRKDLETLKRWLDTGLQAARVVDDRQRQIALLLARSMLYWEQKDFREAHLLAEECQNLSSQTGNTRMERDAFAILALCYKEDKREVEERTFVEKASDKAVESGDWDLLYENPLKVDVAPGVAEAYFDDLLKVPDPIIKLLEGPKSPPLGAIAFNYVNLGKFQKAKDCCIRGLDIAYQTGHKKAQRSFTFLLKKINKAINKQNKPTMKERVIRTLRRFTNMS
jgi:tetratricopeptide (TPR) repeat protein